MEEFRPVSSDDVVKVITQANSKSCELDSLPTYLIKLILPSVAPFLTDLFNESLSSGIVPQQFKEAIIRPLLKKIRPGPEFTEKL